MSDRLAIEMLLREREDLALEVRQERERTTSPRLAVKHRPPRKRPVKGRDVFTRVLLVRDVRKDCADFLLEWWRRKGKLGGTPKGTKHMVSTNDVNRLAGMMRRLEKP